MYKRRMNLVNDGEACCFFSDRESEPTYQFSALIMLWFGFFFPIEDLRTEEVSATRKERLRKTIICSFCVYGRRAMKTVSIRESMERTKGYLIVLMLAIQASVCFLLGAAYIAMGLQHGNLPIGEIIALMILTFISMASVATQWQLFVHGYINKSYLVTPLVVAILMYGVIAVSCNGNRLITALLCAMYAGLNSLLAKSLSCTSIPVMK